MHLYKLEDGTQILKEIKNFSLSVSLTWYEPYNEVLLCTNTNDKGRMQTFFFGEKRSGLRYRGPEFQLEE